MDLEKTRDDILLAALPHVAFDGWSRRSLRLGVEGAGLSPDMADRAFPGGTADLVAHFSAWADRRMLEALDDRDLAAMRVRDRITAGVRLRLEVLAPHREAVRRALAWLALPMNTGLAARLTYHTVNAIWYAAGDDATDFNFYTKRGLLAAVLASTVLYWIADEGDDAGDFPDTWAFLDRRIDNVLQIPRVQAQVKKRLGRLPMPFATARRLRRNLRMAR
ncbi:MAG: COQ9 family protein [Hyphomicrobiales bacterium]|nr:COQ9 family protein [Hyphomicrobiales bacterium]